MNNNMPHISSITFGDGGVEIAYAEPRDIETMESTGILRTRVIMVPIRLVESELDELIDAASDLLDKALIHERNPKATTSFRR